MAGAIRPTPNQQQAQDKLWPNLIAVESGCWAWLGPHTTNGYGQVWLDGVHQTVHRVVYELLIGPIPVGLELDHLCRTRWCANPTHVEPVTHQENLRRGAYARITHCPRGHLYSADNIDWVGPDRRQRKCRACRKVFGPARSRAFRARRKEQAAWL